MNLHYVEGLLSTKKSRKVRELASRALARQLQPMPFVIVHIRAIFLSAFLLNSNLECSGDFDQRTGKVRGFGNFGARKKQKWSGKVKELKNEDIICRDTDLPSERYSSLFGVTIRTINQGGNCGHILGLVTPHDCFARQVFHDLFKAGSRKT